jgi:hypothetical protein
VSNNGSDTVTVLDLEDPASVVSGRAIPVGLDPVDRDGPHHLAVGKERSELYVALAYPPPDVPLGPHAEHGSSQRAGAVARYSLPDFRLLGTAHTDPNPGDVVLSEDGARLVVSHFDLQKAIKYAEDGVEAQRASLLLFDPARIGDSDASPVSIPVCVAPHGVVLSRPSGDVAYVACYGEDALAVVDLADPSHPVERIPLGPAPGPPGSPTYGPYALTLSDDGASIAIGTTISRDLRLYDVATKTVSAAIFSTQGGAFFPLFSPDGKTLLLPTQLPDELIEIDRATMGELRRWTFAGSACSRPHEVRRHPATGDVMLVCEGDHRKDSVVLVLDAKTLETRQTLHAGVYPDRIVTVTTP